MKTLLYYSKYALLSPIAAVSLFIQTYLGALLFFMCISIEQYLIITQSKYSIEDLMDEGSLLWKGKIEYYRSKYESIDFKTFRINF